MRSIARAFTPASGKEKSSIEALPEMLIVADSRTSSPLSARTL